MTAQQNIENRLGKLLEAYKTKKAMRADLCTWFTSFVQTNSFKQLPEKERNKTVDRFASLLKFFV